jgi:hypothetical protein
MIPVRPMNPDKIEFAIAFCKGKKHDVEIPFEEALKILTHFNLYVKEVNRLSGNPNEIQINLKATSEGSLEVIFTILEILKNIQQLSFQVEDLKPVLATIAQNAGILGDGAGTIFSLLKHIKGERIKSSETKIINDSKIEIHGDNYAPITINQTIQKIYYSSIARKELNEVAQVINTSNSFDHIEIRKNKKVVSSLSKAEAEYFFYDEEEDYDFEEKYDDVLRILSSQFVGSAQWKFADKSKKTFKANILDSEWLEQFQKGQININPRFKLNTTIVKKYKYIDGTSYKLVKVEVIKVHDVIKPVSPQKLI